MRYAKDNRNPSIIVHADDYGITQRQSELILSASSACGGNGALNSLSVLANSPAFPLCADALECHANQILIGLHFNMVEGRSCASPDTLKLLTDSSGTFRLSFVDALRLSKTNYQALREDVRREARAQADVLLNRFPQLHTNFRIDSHQHFHMIPAVFDGIVNAIHDLDCGVEYFRIPSEPTAPFVGSAQALRRIAPVNWTKHLLLNALWRKNADKVYGLDRITGVFCGLAFSGNMVSENLEYVVPKLLKIAQRSSKSLELLFHPGGVQERDECLNPALEGFVNFYLSPNREAERKTIQSAFMNSLMPLEG